jgi:GH18 family chitinase/lysophospholipase L1-like esterase
MRRLLFFFGAALVVGSAAANVLLLTNAVPVVVASSKWVDGYYASWETNLYPVNRIDFTAMTHIVLAHWLTNTNGSLQASTMDTIGASIVTPAHAAGVKAIMMLGGSDDVNFATAANATNRAALVSSITSKIASLSLDGVDLDWEVSINNADFLAFVQALRTAAPSAIIIVPLDPSVGTQALGASLAPYVDQINMMTYGGASTSGGWVSWYFSALAGDGTTHPSSLAKWVANFTGAGVPVAKLGMGVGFYARGWTSPVTDALQTIGAATVPIGELAYGQSAANGGGVLSWFYNKCGTYTWSGAQSGDMALAKQPSISIPAGCTPSGWGGSPITWLTYEDEASIAAKASYVNTNGLGGTIIWLLNEGATDPVTGRNPLLDSVKLGFLKHGPAVAPLITTTTANVSGAQSVTITGLATTLTQVVLTWWDGSSTSFDENIGSYGSYGRPSEYYIEASPNGSTWTSLIHVTGNMYNGRQLVADFTGLGYTQVRMRVVSIVGANAGNVTFNIHSAPNNATDTYLLLGDSITSNCWEVATDSFPVETFGTGVHALQASRFPVVTEGGIPGLLASSPLSTTFYGIPAIRQWLNDFPSVKYVGISYGTNDANGNVAAATYCANMQSMVQEVIAAGKTPIVPTIVSSPAANVQANAPAMNACLATMKANYPSVIAGPDLWTLFSGHSVGDGWFFDSLHPSLTTGCNAFQNAWVNTMIAAVYQ